MANKNRRKTRKKRIELLEEFDAAPSGALFPPPTIANLRCCSVANLARDRQLGRGVPFLKIGNRILYRKADYLSWEKQHQQLVHSMVDEANTQATREVLNVAVAASGEG
jgi:hypothetical protein